MTRARGRPPLPEGHARRATIALRATAELRTRLGEAALASGRSLSQEAELRLENSFRDDEILAILARIEARLDGHLALPEETAAAIQDLDA